MFKYNYEEPEIDVVHILRTNEAKTSDEYFTDNIVKVIEKVLDEK